MKARVPTRPVYAPDVIRVTGVRAYSHLVRIASICARFSCVPSKTVIKALRSRDGLQRLYRAAGVILDSFALRTFTARA